jgi:hypothetical protein
MWSMELRGGLFPDLRGLGSALNEPFQRRVFDGFQVLPRSGGVKGHEELLPKRRFNFVQLKSVIRNPAEQLLRSSGKSCQGANLLVLILRLAVQPLMLSVPDPVSSSSDHIR